MFICSGDDEIEALGRKLFGLPKELFADMQQQITVPSTVRQVRGAGAPTLLFLYNIEKQLLFGVFEAASQPTLHIVREAWNRQLPAQIRIRVVGDYAPALVPRDVLPPGCLTAAQLQHAFQMLRG